LVGKDGLIVDEKTWAIRYIIVNTSNWWLGHKVVISPEWIDDVDWPESKLSIDLTRQGYWPREAKHSPVPARL